MLNTGMNPPSLSPARPLQALSPAPLSSPPPASSPLLQLSGFSPYSNAPDQGSFAASGISQPLSPAWASLPQSPLPNSPWPAPLTVNGSGGFPPLRPASGAYNPWAAPNGAAGFSTETLRLTPSPNSTLGGTLTPAQETGKQVGDLVTRFLEETPALQEKIQHIDWNAISQEDLKPKVEKYRAVFQQALKHAHVPQMVDRKLIRLLDDPKNQQLATELDAWLRKDPTPDVLASLHKPKQQRPSTGDGFGKPTLDEAFDDGEAMQENDPPQSFIGKQKARVQDGYNRLKDFVFNRTGSLKAQSKVKPDAAPLGEDDFGDNEWSP